MLCAHAEWWFAGLGTGVSHMVESSPDSPRRYRDGNLEKSLGIGAGAGATFLGETQFGGDAVAGDKIVYLPPQERTAPAQLPADVHDFTGRQEILDHLGRLTAADGPRTAVLTAIHGMGGVGKTALAVHWAHQVAAEFPDGQLYVDLRGYSDDAAMTPNEALGRFLRALGVPVQLIPEDVDERAALYRSVLSERRILVLRPLLPGSRSCLTLVTSRSQLPALVAQSGAASLAVDVLSAGESVELITNMLGADIVAAERAAVAELAQRCAYLPLALRIAAAHVAMGSYGSIAELADELARGDRLSALECDDDPQLAVRSAFELSYRNLGDPLRRAFRRLGLVEGPDFTREMVAALTDTSEDAAGRLIRTLVHAHLVEPKPYGRFRLHDLLREYARELVRAEESATDRDAAVDALLSWYVAAADRQGLCLVGHRPRLSGRLPAGSPPGDHATALAWFEGERLGLLAAARQAHRLSRERAVCELADAVYDYLWLRRYHQDNLEIQQSALTAARSSGDARAEAYALRHLCMIHRGMGRYGEALRCGRDALQACRSAGRDATHSLHMLRTLAGVYAPMGEYAKALDCLAEDLRISQELGDRHGEAATLTATGLVQRSLGNYSAALDNLRRGAQIDREIGNRRGEGIALQHLAATLRDTGAYRQAFDHAQRSLDARLDSGDQVGEAWTLNLLTLLCLNLGRHQDSIRYSRQALALRQATGDRGGEAAAMDTLSRLHRMLGDHSEARHYAEQAVALRRETGSRGDEAESLETLARALRAAGDFPLSYEIEQQALRLRREIGDRQGEARTLRLLAQCMVRLDRPAEALDYAEESLVVSRRIGDRHREANALNTIASIHRELDRLPDAIAYARQALGVRQEIGDRRGEAEALDDISRSHLEMGQPAAALEHARQALAVEREIGDLFGQGRTLDHLAHVQLALGRRAQALRNARRSLEIHEQVNDPNAQSRSLDTLSRIHLVCGRREEALESALRALAIARDGAKPADLVHRLRDVARLTEQIQGAAAAKPYRDEAAGLEE
jgi:tetratricopeptide (TPR) repeat protein